jgi:hypothetical protein
MAKNEGRSWPSGVGYLDTQNVWIKHNQNTIGCRVPIALSKFPAETAAVSHAYAAVSQDANRSPWYAAAVHAFAIVTRARQSRRVFCHGSDESTAVASLVVAFRAVSFSKLKFRIAALDFKRSG